MLPLMIVKNMFNNNKFYSIIYLCVQVRTMLLLLFLFLALANIWLCNRNGARTTNTNISQKTELSVRSTTDEEMTMMYKI